ncbi:hypothetical protein FXO38_25387 [Capsicum annuum]|nr:hypothetical protein FXO38_25387 [Capsicum annuum]
MASSHNKFLEIFSLLIVIGIFAQNLDPNINVKAAVVLNHPEFVNSFEISTSPTTVICSVHLLNLSLSSTVATECATTVTPTAMNQRADPKCQRLDDANKVSELMEVENMVSWNALVTGYSQIGRFDETLGLFERMREEEIELNVVTWSVVISGYAQRDLG